MNKKIALMLVAVLVCGALTSCNKKNDDGLGVSREVVEENTEKTIEVNGEILPGIDQTTVIIHTVMLMNDQENDTAQEIIAYSKPDEKVLMTSEELFDKKPENGIEYVNAVIQKKGEQADIDKVNADYEGKLKGTVTDYNEVLLSISNLDDGRMVDVLTPMVLIDGTWYLLDMRVAG